MPQRIRIVAHDRSVRSSRVQLLRSNGYEVTFVTFDDEAIVLLNNEQFDVVLIGHGSMTAKVRLDQWLREAYPEMLILQIENLKENSTFPSRIIRSRPEDVLEAIHEMLHDA